MFEKYEREIKKELNCRLRSEVVDSEVCQGFATDEVKADLQNINPAKAAGPGKFHPRFLHHLGRVPQEWRVSDIRPIPKGGNDLQKMEIDRPISLTRP